MDAFTKHATNLLAAQQHARAARLLIQEGADEIEESVRRSTIARGDRSWRAALEASAERDWTRAPDVRAGNERLAAKWRIVPHTENAILVTGTIASRTLMTSSGAAGGNLVESPHLLQAREAHDTAGEIFGLMNVVTAASAAGNQSVGKFETLPTVSVLGTETSAATELTPPATMSLLSPKNLVTWGRHSRQWAIQTPAGADAVARLHLAAVRGKALQQILEGAGTSGQILGLAANSDVPTAVGTSVDWAKVCAAMESAEKTGSGPFAWVVSAAAAKVLRQRAEITGGSAILRDSRIGGYPCFVTGCTTNAVAFFGAWGDLTVFQFRPIELAVDPYSDFSGQLIGLRAWLTIDAAPALPKSFYSLTGIT